MNIKKNYDTLIIGAGAAGLFCAIEAAKRGRKVVVIDHNTKAGAKILVSGGGRCNFTNLNTTPENFVSQNPHFCKSALSRYTPHHFLELIQKHKIAYVEKKPGQLFCQNSAKDILNMLLHECEQAGVKILLETKVLSIQKDPENFLTETSQGNFSSETLVIATGGLSLPQIGATGFGYEIAKQFHMNIIPTSPALDGFRGNPEFQDLWKTLSGLSTPVCIRTKTKNFEDDLLITHQGLSGPAALQASLYWKQKESIEIDWCQNQKLSEWFLEKKNQGEKKTFKTLMGIFWPSRLAEHLATVFEFPSKPLVEISNQTILELVEKIHHWTWTPEKTVGYARAEVTRGGVDTDHFSSKTLESKSISGLFFVGEVLDVTGELGGYNFQWAWSSGWAAGKSC
ncbi:MAG: NAD(P)/FAD-dependent oxidoreductase [Deltaproteobacteria bacterium]|nr:MAG: NAD(P)/FAD-dependent oxidoreductase [Deltaproteobacteria bacterium]